MSTTHAFEEEEFGQGPRLWDATPGVCCAAYQLGACPHTEDAYYDAMMELDDTPAPAPRPAPRPPAPEVDYPF